MSQYLLVFFSVLLLGAQADVPRLGFGLQRLGLERIVGGSNATKGEFPHQVSLQWGLPPLGPVRHFCGGTIINSEWILTAGHCVLAVPNFRSIIVKAGKYQLQLSESTEQTVQAAYTFVHESYVGGVAPYDIALLKLKSPLKLNSAVKAINLPKLGSKPNGTSTLSGWGAITSTGLITPSILQKANLPIIDYTKCKSALESLIGPSPLDDTNICTGPLTGGFSACSGDSGGPLIAENNGVPELIGVVSWGIIPCGTVGAPSVYTDVASFVSWIESTIKQY